MQTRLGLVLCSIGVMWTMFGCEAPGVGDPCEPESIPEGGFVPSEAYLETSSVQCRTRVCMVYQLPGYPNRENDCDPATLPRRPDGSPATCATQGETEERVYCTCRCDAPAGDASTCECPDEYDCVEVLDSEFAGPGIRGSYCVKSNTVSAD
jgi:hypothetical protein